MEVLEHRLAPAVQLLYTGPGGTLSLTEGASGATPTVTVSESTANLLRIDLGTGNHFDAASTGSAMGLAYSSGTPAASQFATLDIGRANNVRTLEADLAGDALVVGGIMDSVGGLGNVSASARTIRMMGLDTSHASVGNGNVDLKAAGDLIVGGTMFSSSAVLDTGPGTIALAADVNPDGSGNNGLGTLTVQPGSVVVSDNAGSSAITLRGAAVHLGADASVGARRVIASTAPVTPFLTTGISQPQGMAFDASGNLYVANQRTGTVSKVAAGSTTGVPFITSGLSQPFGLAFDASGNLYVGNYGNSTISRVAAGTTTATPFVTSGLNGPSYLAFDAGGNLYVSNYNGNTVSKVAAGTSTATPFITSGLDLPYGVAFDASGNLYIVSTGTNIVSKVAPGASTAVPFVTSGLFRPWDMAFDVNGNFYVANFFGGSVSKVAAGSSTPTLFVTGGLNAPTGVAFDASGNLYITTAKDDRMWKATAATLAPAVTGGVVIRSSLPNRPMLVGDTTSPVSGINLSSAELADIRTTATGTLTFGDDNQTGDITFRTARPASTVGAAIVVKQAPDGPGRVVLDDAGASSALVAGGASVGLTAGAGGIVAANSGAGLFEVATTAPVTLDTSGAAGTAASPLHLTAATLAAHAEGGLNLVTQVGQLAADGGSGGASIRDIGNLRVASLSSLTGVTAAGAVSVRAAGNLVVSANVASTGAGNVVLQADDSLSVDPAATVQASAGALQLIAGFGAFSSGSTLAVHGDSLLGAAAVIELGFDPAVTCRLVPGGSTPITLDGGGNGLLELNDQGNATGRTFSVTNNTIGWGGPALTYAGLGALTIEGGPGGNTFNIQTTAASAAVSLVGGAGGDTFHFADGAALAGNIVGGSAGTLDYSAYTTSVVVNLQTGLATGVGGSVSGIRSVLGGSGTPAASGTYNLLIGAGGNILLGGTGRRNLLVAGGSASILLAGDNEDLLIAGSTSYDGDAALANWLQIAAYWAGSDDFLTRAANLASGTGVPLLDATIVTGNGGGNVLAGYGRLALIFSDGLDTITGFDPSSLQVTIGP
jgi:DNA-binding beta-propeller fold protein YncE